jgi:uncharacterized protein (TIGR00369 family)
MTDVPTPELPPGFIPFPARGGFALHNGPLFIKRGDGNRICFGFRCLDRHLNSGGTCHGGWQATVVDMAICTTAALAAGGRRYPATVTLNSEFFAPIRPGQWVEAWAETLKVTRNLAFADCRVYADGVLAVHASGTMKLPSQEAPVDFNDIFPRPR